VARKSSLRGHPKQYRCWGSQAPRERDGQNSVVGKTATLELKQARPKRWQGRQTGILSLALRSLVDANVDAPRTEESKDGASVTVFVVTNANLSARRCAKKGGAAANLHLLAAAIPMSGFVRSLSRSGAPTAASVQSKSPRRSAAFFI